MSPHLSAQQTEELRALLAERQRQLDRRLAEHQGGGSRAEHAREVLQQDADDAPQREGEREVDMALSDFELQELGATSEALRRLAAGTYGRCADCDAPIPLARLRAAPATTRCIACATRHDRR